MHLPEKFSPDKVLMLQAQARVSDVNLMMAAALSSHLSLAALCQGHAWLLEARASAAVTCSQMFKEFPTTPCSWCDWRRARRPTGFRASGPIEIEHLGHCWRHDVLVEALGILAALDCSSPEALHFP